MAHCWMRSEAKVPHYDEQRIWRQDRYQHDGFRIGLEPTKEHSLPDAEGNVTLVADIPLNSYFFKMVILFHGLLHWHQS